MVNPSRKIHLLHAAAGANGIVDSISDEALNKQRQQGEQQVVEEQQQYQIPSSPPVTPGQQGQQSTVSSASVHFDRSTVEELNVQVPGPRVHAPWLGLHGVCEGCSTLIVSGLGSGPTECEHCHRQIAGDQGDIRAKASGKGSATAAVQAGREGKDGVVAVTSSREVALGDERAKALARVGVVMLTTSSMLLLLLLVVWRGINLSLVSTLSPWLGIFLPIPLGLLNGAWSLHCAKCGHTLHHSTGSCATRGGLCGTAWGCSGPSCAVNLGLDLGLLITALLASLPAGASARGCGYDCFVLLCFPCAPGGGEGMAVGMVVMTLGLAFAAGFKMWMMALALLRGKTQEEIFLPW